MNIPAKKLKTGFEMPVFGIGTWRMGGARERDLGNDDEADIAAIKAAMDLGVTHIDTAELYAGGHAETMIGSALEGRDRSKIFLVSKVKDDHFAYDGILRACENSLKRLKTNYLDLYLLHWYSDEFPLKDSIRALDRLVEEGLVRNIGVSNFGIEHLAEAQSHSAHKIVCDQVHYNLECREPEASGLLEYCQTHDIFLVAYRPVGKGSLLQQVPPVLQEMCEKYQKTPAQVAINWLISQPSVITIAKTRHMEHLQENLGALDWEMRHEDIESLRREYPGQQKISDTVPLE